MNRRCEAMKSPTLSQLISLASSLAICSSYEQGTLKNGKKETVESNAARNRKIFVVESVDLEQEPCETTSVPDDNTPQCGVQANGLMCPNNYCCSRYGFCGLSSAWCGAGCQSGPCEDEDENFNYNYCKSANLRVL